MAPRNAYAFRRGTGDAVFREFCKANNITDRKPPEPEIGWGMARVYFVHSRSEGLIKIGFTENWEKRRLHVRSQAKQRGELIGFLNGGRLLEGLMHEKFAEYRIQGEWFSDEILPMVETLIQGDRDFFGIESRERRSDAPPHLRPAGRGGSRD